MRNAIVNKIPAFMMIMSFVVLFGWYSHNSYMVQLNSEESTWPPMSQWAALLFGVTGLTYLGKRTLRYSLWSACFVGAFSVIFLLERLLGVEILGIDRVWGDSWASHHFTQPGRLAFGTGVCFFLISITMLIRTRFSREMLGSAILAISGLHILNFGFDPARIHANTLSQMATNSAMCFALWGIFLIYGGRDERSD